MLLCSFKHGLQAGAPEGACHDNVWKCFIKKLKSILNYISFLHRWIGCDEKIKKYVTFHVYFSSMQNFFISNVESFFLRAFFFRKKTGFVSTFFVNVFSKVIDDNRSRHMISPFHFFILCHLWCNMNTHTQTQRFTGYEMNAYRRRLFSNCFDSRSNDISWTSIYKYAII